MGKHLFRKFSIDNRRIIPYIDLIETTKDDTLKKTILSFAAVMFGSAAYAAEPHYDPDIQCLAQAIYFEIGSDHYTLDQKRNVAWVILNRGESKHYPNTLCGVVKQANRDENGKIKKWQCAFSFYCDGKPDVVPNNELELIAWQEAKDVAELVVNQQITGVQDPTGGADHYHTPAVNPNWVDEDKITADDGAHIFYDLYKG